MNKWNIYILTALFFIGTACTTDENPIINPPDGKPGDESAVTVKIAFPDAEPGTYALTAAQEHIINSLEIFVFTSGGTGNMLDDTYAYRIYVPGSQINNNNTSPNKEATITIKNMQARQRFVLLANKPTSAVLLAGDTVAGTTKLRDIVGKLKFGSDVWKNLPSAANPGIPMWGQMTDSVKFTASNLPEQTIKMIRSLAKVEVKVAAGIGDKFRIKNVYVVDATDSAYIAPNDYYLTTQANAAITLIDRINPAVNRTNQTYAYPTYTAGGTSLEKTIYLPESDTLKTTPVNKPAYLVLEATYGDHSSGTPASTFYRVDFAKDGKYQQLTRNNTYTVNVLQAKTAGYPSLQEAKDAPESLTNIDLVLDVDNDINDITFNDTHLFGTHTSTVLFDWNQGWIGQPTGAKKTYEMNLTSTYDGNWKASVDKDWVRISKLNIPGAGVAAINTGAKTDKKMYIEVVEDNRTGADRTATITFRAGMLTHTVTVRQSGGANSRMITFGTGGTASTSIPLAFAHKARGDNAFNNVTIGLEARVLWQEAGEGQTTFDVTLSGLGADLTQYQIDVTATKGTTGYGNAVIAIVNIGTGVPMVGGTDNDEILWSWHVWSMPAKDDMDANYHNPNLPLLMNNAMGRYSTNKGMFYQWGRKDPFPRAATDIMPSAVIVRTPAMASTTRADGVKNPTTFYYEKDGIKEWASNIKNTDWYHVKAYNDPCPVGWRVCTRAEILDNWDANTPNVSNFILGQIVNTTGMWEDQLANGFIWQTGRTDMADAIQLSGSGISLIRAISTYGFSVRCIKDTQLIKTSF